MRPARPCVSWDSEVHKSFHDGLRGTYLITHRFVSGRIHLITFTALKSEARSKDRAPYYDSLQACPLLPSITLCARPVPGELPVSLRLPAGEDLKNASISTTCPNFRDPPQPLSHAHDSAVVFKTDFVH